MSVVSKNFNQIDIVIQNITAERDEFAEKLYNIGADFINKKDGNKLIVDLIVIQYYSIRSIYDFEELNNIKYRNSKPTPHTIFGSDNIILTSLIIQVEILNEVLHFLKDNYSISDFNQFQNIIQELLSIDNDVSILNNTPAKNLEIYKEKMEATFKRILEMLDNIK